MSVRVALIDDDSLFRRMMSEVLSSEGFVVEAFEDGPRALAALTAQPPDAVLLDLWMPGMDGIQVCGALRSDPRTARVPILMLTGSTDQDDQLLGFEVGADDYIHKPIVGAVLLARLRAALRRAAPHGGGTSITLGGLTIDGARREVVLDGRALNLTPTEFRILHALASAPGRVLTRAELLEEEAEGPEAARRTIDVHIHTLRRKLGRHHTLVDTAWGAGYRLGPLPPPLRS
jgi:DNA-binding response OmpR family regulator